MADLNHAVPKIDDFFDSHVTSRQNTKPVVTLPLYFEHSLSSKNALIFGAVPCNKASNRNKADLMRLFEDVKESGENTELSSGEEGDLEGESDRNMLFMHDDEQMKLEELADEVYNKVSALYISNHVGKIQLEDYQLDDFTFIDEKKSSKVYAFLRKNDTSTTVNIQRIISICIVRIVGPRFLQLKESHTTKVHRRMFASPLHSLVVRVFANETIQQAVARNFMIAVLGISYSVIKKNTLYFEIFQLLQSCIKIGENMSIINDSDNTYKSLHYRNILKSQIILNHAEVSIFQNDQLMLLIKNFPFGNLDNFIVGLTEESHLNPNLPTNPPSSASNTIIRSKIEKLSVTISDKFLKKSPINAYSPINVNKTATDLKSSSKGILFAICWKWCDYSAMLVPPHIHQTPATPASLITPTGNPFSKGLSPFGMRSKKNRLTPPASATHNSRESQSSRLTPPISAGYSPKGNVFKFSGKEPFSSNPYENEMLVSAVRELQFHLRDSVGLTENIKVLSDSSHRWCLSLEQIVDLLLDLPDINNQMLTDCINYRKSKSVQTNTQTETEQNLLKKYRNCQLRLTSDGLAVLIERLLNQVFRDIPENVKDNKLELLLIKKLFPNSCCVSLHVLSGGFSGGKVFHASSILWTGDVELGSVVKIDNASTLRVELSRMRQIRTMLGDHVPAVLCQAFEESTSTSGKSDAIPLRKAAIRMEMCGVGWTQSPSIANNVSNDSAQILCTFKQLYKDEMKLIESKTTYADHYLNPHKATQKMKSSYGHVTSVIDTCFGDILDTPSLSTAVPRRMNLFSHYRIDAFLQQEIFNCSHNDLALKVGLQVESHNETAITLSQLLPHELRDGKYKRRNSSRSFNFDEFDLDESSSPRGRRSAESPSHIARRRASDVSGDHLKQHLYVHSMQSKEDRDPSIKDFFQYFQQVMHVLTTSVGSENEEAGIAPVVDNYLVRTVHGDLNGANILIDSQESIWIIDWPHLGTKHALFDIAKLESSILFEYSNIRDEAELLQTIYILVALNNVTSLQDALPTADALGLLGNSVFTWEVLCSLHDIAGKYVDVNHIMYRKSRKQRHHQRIEHFHAINTPPLHTNDAVQLSFANISNCLKALKYQDINVFQKRASLMNAVMHAHSILCYAFKNNSSVQAAVKQAGIQVYSDTKYYKYMNSVLIPLTKSLERLNRFNQESHNNESGFNTRSDLSRHLYCHHLRLYFRDMIRSSRYVVDVISRAPVDILEYNWHFTFQDQKSSVENLERNAEDLLLDSSETGKEFLRKVFGETFNPTTYRRVIITARPAQGKSCLLRKLLIQSAFDVFRSSETQHQTSYGRSSDLSSIHPSSISNKAMADEQERERNQNQNQTGQKPRFRIKSSLSEIFTTADDDDTDCETLHDDGSEVEEFDLPLQPSSSAAEHLVIATRKLQSLFNTDSPSSQASSLSSGSRLRRELSAPTCSESNELAADASPPDQMNCIVPVIIPLMSLLRIFATNRKSKSNLKRTTTSKTFLGEDSAVATEASDDDLLLIFLAQQYGRRSSRFKMLLTAYKNSKLLVCLDAFDESGSERMRMMLHDYVIKVLVPSGNRIIITSRPQALDMSSGDNSKLFENFRHIEMNSLTPEMQLSIVDQRMTFDPPEDIAQVKRLLRLPEYAGIADSPLLISVLINAFRDKVYRLRIGFDSSHNQSQISSKKRHETSVTASDSLNVSKVYNHALNLMLRITDISRLSGNKSSKELEKIDHELKLLSDPIFEDIIIRPLAFGLHLQRRREFTVDDSLQLLPSSSQLIYILNVMFKSVYESRIPLFEYRHDISSDDNDSAAVREHIIGSGSCSDNGASPTSPSGSGIGIGKEELNEYLLRLRHDHSNQVQSGSFIFAHKLWQEHLTAMFIHSRMFQSIRVSSNLSPKSPKSPNSRPKLTLNTLEEGFNRNEPATLRIKSIETDTKTLIPPPITLSLQSSGENNQPMGAIGRERMFSINTLSPTNQRINHLRTKSIHNEINDDEMRRFLVNLLDVIDRHSNHTHVSSHCRSLDVLVSLIDVNEDFDIRSVKTLQGLFLNDSWWLGPRLGIRRMLDAKHQQQFDRIISEICQKYKIKLLEK